MDSEFDLISQYIGLNIGLDEFKPRLHPSYHKVAPVKIQPMMESYRTGEAVNTLQHDVWENNVLLSRTETLLLNTLESDRLSRYSILTDRLPSQTLQFAFENSKCSSGLVRGFFQQDILNYSCKFCYRNPEIQSENVWCM